MPIGGVRQEHESFGMLQFSRTSSNKGTPLFGSSIEHSNTIVMRLCKGTVERGLSTDWYYAGGQLFEVEMSQTQFAEAITSMNMGSGIPVTIRYIGGKKMEDCPFTNKRLQFEQEFKNDMKKLAANMRAVTEKAEAILTGSKAPTKAEKTEILNALYSLRQLVGSSIPFVQSCFNEQMDKTVLEAKGEIEALVANTVNKLGLESLEQLVQLGGVANDGLRIAEKGQDSAL